MENFEDFDAKHYMALSYSKKVLRHFFGIIDVSWVDKIFEKQNAQSDHVFGQISLYYYRLIRYIIEHKLCPPNSQNIVAFMQFVEKITSNYVSPFCIVEQDVNILGTHVYIYGDYKICAKTNIFSGVQIGDKNYDQNIINNIDSDTNLGVFDNKTYVVDKNCTIENAAKVCFCDIGEGVIVCSNAIVRENICAHSRVEKLNQLQITQTKKSYLPSQELEVYGVVPKYKNTLTIYGDGIYNPNVIIRHKGKKVLSQIEYWDKTKIILKLKALVDKGDSFDKCLEQKIPLNVEAKNIQNFVNDEQTIIVVMSRGIKVSITDNKIVEKLLKNI